MPRWCYKVLCREDEVGWYDETGVSVCGIDDLCTALNVLGADCWEVVQSNKRRIILKKEA
jgi:hypothetical protein